MEKLKVWMLPTLALIKHEKTVDYVVGFDELGGKDDFPTEALAERLARVEMINDDGAARQRAAQQAPQTSIRAGFNNRTGSDEDSDFDE